MLLPFTEKGGELATICCYTFMPDHRYRLCCIKQCVTGPINIAGQKPQLFRKLDQSFGHILENAEVTV